MFYHWPIGTVYLIRARFCDFARSRQSIPSTIGMALNDPGYQQVYTLPVEVCVFCNIIRCYAQHCIYLHCISCKGDIMMSLNNRLLLSAHLSLQQFDGATCICSATDID